MFDARFFAYATISAVLVVSPGATMAVVMETAVGEGRVSALRTVLGINIANSSLALASALGLSAALTYWPWTLQAVKVGGAIYLSWLGARGLWRAAAGRQRTGSNAAPEPARPRFSILRSTFSVLRSPSAPGARGWAGGWRAPVARGILTNLLNPPVVLFYTALLPQFIGAEDPFFTRFMVLAAVHVSMSLSWLSIYAFALGLLSERLARPGVRRTMEAITGALLVGFGVKLVL